MVGVQWDRFPFIAEQAQAKRWLNIQINLGLAQNTVLAYGRALEDYLRFCSEAKIDPLIVTQEHLASYVRDLSARPHPAFKNSSVGEAQAGLSNATMQQRLTAVRLYYDFLVEEGHGEYNPVRRGRFASLYGKGQRGLLPRYHKLPWIPAEAEWNAILQAARSEPLRNRLMFSLGYDAGLRREELCLLETRDIDPAHRLVQIRAETTKNRQARVVPYSATTSALYAAYLAHRREMSRERGPLFLSESHRNSAQPISIWTWSKVIQGMAERSGVQQLSTHTLRHLRLTDLARAGWDIHEIALFAGHRTTQSTLQYIHLSGRDLAGKLARGMAELHATRMMMLKEVLLETENRS